MIDNIVRRAQKLFGGPILKNEVTRDQLLDVSVEFYRVDLRGVGWLFVE